VVRALTSHPGSISGLGIIFGLSLLLVQVPFSVPRGFSLGTESHWIHKSFRLSTPRNGDIEIPVIRKAKCYYCGMNCGVDDSKVIIIKQDGRMMV